MGILTPFYQKWRYPTGKNSKYIVEFQHSFGSLSHSNQRIKRNKRNPDWKRRSKTICGWHDPLNKSPKDTTRKLPELINEYSKVSRHKIKTQKSLTFLYMNNEKTEREIKETIPLTIAMKRIKYIGKNKQIGPK